MEGIFTTCMDDLTTGDLHLLLFIYFFCFYHLPGTLLPLSSVQTKALCSMEKKQFSKIGPGKQLQRICCCCFEEESLVTQADPELATQSRITLNF